MHVGSRWMRSKVGTSCAAVAGVVLAFEPALAQEAPAPPPPQEQPFPAPDPAAQPAPLPQPAAPVEPPAAAAAPAAAEQRPSAVPASAEPALPSSPSNAAPPATPPPAPWESTPAEADSSGSEPLQNVEDASLEELLSTDAAVAEVGSYGLRLKAWGVSLDLHAYATIEYHYTERDEVYYGAGRSTSTFDTHYFNLIASANLADVVYPELHLEHEHASQFEIRTAQVDFKVHDLLVIRAGHFLMPFGYFNEYMLPEFVTKFPRRPFTLTNSYIVPSTWSETGVQLRGKYEFDRERQINYAVYAVNGLEQPGAEDDQGNVVVAEGGSLRSMRGNFRDVNDTDKAVGGRLGVVPLQGLEIGGSVYTGAYTIDGQRRLTMVGGDIGFTRFNLTLRAEYDRIYQQIGGGRLDKRGFWILAAYKMLDVIEPALMFDQIRMDAEPTRDLSRFSAGLNVYPYPTAVPQLVTRVAYGWTWNRGPVQLRDNLFVAQTAVGF